MSFKCRKCGEGMYVSAHPCRGLWKTLYDANGEACDSDLDAVKYGPTPKTVTCGSCGARHPNPALARAGDKARRSK